VRLPLPEVVDAQRSGMTRTTPPRPDVVAAVPELAAYARTATRLHPRRGSPRVGDSSIGGPLLWPAEEPWPVCTADNAIAHRHVVNLRRPADERLCRRILSAAWGRTRRGQRLRLYKEERALLAHATLPAPTSELDRAAPLPLLAVAQLYRRDVPDLAGPKEADLLQVLWCPFTGHGGVDNLWDLAVVLKWRRVAEVDVKRLLVDQPEPPVMESGDYLPEPCVLHPEQVVEYPELELLPDQLQRRLRRWEQDTGHHYWDLAIAAGWKVGGWPRGVGPWKLWRRPLVCACGELLELLLKIEGAEWGYDEDRGDYPWRPVEDVDSDGEFEVFSAETQPTMIMIGDAYRLWVFTCPASPDHPVRTTVEW
jgi:hypothetical protein